MIVPRPLAATLTLGLSLGLGGTAVAMPAPHDLASPDLAAHVLRTTPQQETADDLPPGAVVADGPIDQLSRDGDTLYATGAFNRVGRYAGPGAVLSAGTGATVASATLADGQVSVVISDGDGGWYLGGDFTRIGGHPAGGLAHVLADGDVDPDFHPVADGLVSAVALSGDTLWFGGQFDTVDGATRTNLAAVSVTDGALLPFAASHPDPVTELAYAPQDGARAPRLFVGGYHLTALDPSTGAAVPGFATVAVTQVRALLVSGDTLYVGDSRLRAVDVGTGTPVAGFTTWPVGGYGSVHTLLASGSTLYVGTDVAAHRLLALDAATGARVAGFAPTLTGSNAMPNSRGGVYDLALDGGRLWVGGAFTAVDGEPAGGLAVLDAATGDAADVAVPSYDQQVNAVELSADQAYVGGTFWTTDWQDTQGLAAFDATTLEPKAGFHSGRWNDGDLLLTPHAGYVADNHFMGYDTTELADDGDYYYAYHTRIDAFDPETGANLGAIRVRRMAGATTVGNRLYVAQRLTDDVRFPEHRILVFNSAGKQVDSFAVPLRGYVTTMATVDGELLLGGSFKRWAQHVHPAHTAMLRLDPATGARRAYFNPRIHGPVYDLAVEGRHVYAAGLFTRIDQRTGGRRAGVVALGPHSRLDASFVPQGTNRSVMTRLHPAGDTVWAGGRLFLDATTGARTADPTGWSDRDSSVQALTTGPTGIAWSSYLTLNLGGTHYFRMGFVSTTSD